MILGEPAYAATRSVAPIGPNLPYNWEIWELTDGRWHTAS